jgi:catechol 2,3-dioxygenase-like lactoylglutathione lyase family enzyme
MIKIHLTSVFVDDQEKALDFYTNTLGFVKETDIPVGEHRFLTVVSPQQPDGTRLLLEPNVSQIAKGYQDAAYTAGHHVIVFEVDDICKEHERLSGLGVKFRQAPTPLGPVTVAVLDDTCGNLIQLAQAA